MAKQKSFTVVVFAAIAVFGGVLAAAMWWGKYHVAASAPLPTHEISDFSSKDAVSENPHSPPSYAHDTPELPDRNVAEVPPHEDSPAEEPIRLAKATPSPVPLNEIRARLDQLGPEAGGPERVEMESALGFALLTEAEPDLRSVGKAFTTALDHTPTPDARVPMARDFGVALLDHRGEAEVLDVTESGRFIGARLTPERLQIEAIRGVAYDGLGLGIRAQDTFRDAFETMLDTELYATDIGRDVARGLALRLARKYRDAGDASSEDAVSKRLRAWLGEESLALR